DATDVTFNGSTAQTISGTGATCTFQTLTISNSSGVSLARNIVLTPESGGGAAANLTISTDAIFDLAGFTCNRSAAGGTFTVNNGATLKIGGTNTFPANYSTHTLGATSTVEYAGTNQSISAETYGNLTTSGSGTKTMIAVTVVNGTCTISSG